MDTRAEALEDRIFQSVECIPLVVHTYLGLKLNHMESYQEKVFSF